MLNRLFKTSEFGKIKARMHNDRIVYVLTENPKPCSSLIKASKTENPLNEQIILKYFGIDYSEMGEIFQFYN